MPRENYTVTMDTRTRPENSLGNVPIVPRHLPEFLVPASSPGEAIIKIRAMFPEDLRIKGAIRASAEIHFFDE